MSGTAGSSGSGTKPEFSVRIAVCDHYLTKPLPGLDVIYSDFRGSDIKQVPILRVFGPTPDGHKACLHIHGVFPYFYIPCPTPNPEPQFLYQIAASLDKALNIALKQATSVQQHVYKISLVKGLPFYGFHYKDHLYLKVFLYNPRLIKQAVELCSNGAILGQPFQPHESHLNFTLQFFIDFNLFGMSSIDLQTVMFRKSGLSQDTNEPIESPDNTFLKAESSCFYEADCVACHIINRQRIGKGDGIENPGLEEVWNQEKERRKQLNMSIASKSLSQNRMKAEETESHYKYEQIFLIKMSNDINNPVKVESEPKDDSEKTYYPAESMEDSQLFDAVDVSVHLPDRRHSISLSETFRKDLDDTLTEDADNTIVDENVALNCSLHYSQVLLNTEDLELVDMLQDMDEQDINVRHEEDSVMCTPAAGDKESDDDDEYSQAFNEETVLMDMYKSRGDGNESSWNDSFWEGANIPQLDGTFDDDHVKKVRKRKMRPFKLGLSRPKKISNTSKIDKELRMDKGDSDCDEINASRETINSISSLHLKKVVVKTEPQSFSENSNETNTEEQSIIDLVDKISLKHNNEVNVADSYDIQNNFIPEAGYSNVNRNHDEDEDDDDDDEDVMKLSNDSTFIEDTIESSFESKKGIMSFYDMSKVFDTTQNNQNLSLNNDETECDEIEIDNSDKVDEDINIDVNDLNMIKTEPSAIITPKIRPPTKNYIISSLKKYNIPKVKNLQPFYSDHKDVGDKVEIGQIILKVQSKLSKDQKPLERVLDATSIEEWRQLLFMQNHEMSENAAKPEVLKSLLAGNKNTILEAVIRPPTKLQVIKSLEEIKEEKQENNVDKEISKNLDDLDNSQAIGLNEDEINNSINLESQEKANENNALQITMQPDGSYLCFGGSENQKDNTIDGPAVEVDFLTIMLIEVLTSVREDLHPDPMLDPIQAIFIKVTNDCPPDHFLQKSITQIIAVDNMTPPKLLDRCIFNVNVTYVNNENELLEQLIGVIKKHDPDIMCGYEIEMNSWGYVLERSQVLGLEMVREISRITEKHRQKKWRGEDNDIEGKIIGRISFNVWRLFRHELALSSYSFENCMYEVLKERVPKYSYAQLADWWNHESRIFRWIPVEYYMTRLTGTVRMLEKLDIINRTSELARLFGLQWWEVLSRGSQFRVESLMLRAARPVNLIALSPTVKQRAAMKAPECLPLIFEPESRFYADPVIVLDFQSLYPSMMIAYNYCFSTCIGRVQNINGESDYEFGAWRLRIPKAKLEALVKSGQVHWSPVGVGFVQPAVRRGVLPALLRRILAARQAVKKTMKLQTDEAVKKAMHSRQLGLKLIANVTYGYTAANFSGRMPCVEVGDSVVSKGRETLERAIKLVRNGPWNAKVVYGDTDSMFVVVPGGSRAEAFAIGQQIADAVTADNPSPVVLKLEKVYQPCILQTKKRYVGYMYESPDQTQPVYEAKGIETVRRDGCPAGVKLLHRALCTLFSTGDVSRVKRDVVRLLAQLADDELPIQELFFTREYNGPTGYKPGAVAVPNEIAKRIASRDRRAVPRPGWRVSWLVTSGAPSTPLVKLSRTPAELARSPARPHVGYYATRVLLPPLHRCLALLGVDVFKWWCELGYGRTASHHRHATTSGIARYMWRCRCALCGARGSRAVCADCAADCAKPVAAVMATRLNVAQTMLRHCDTICTSCCGHTLSENCENTECPLLWRRQTAREKLDEVRDVVTNLPSQFSNESFDF